MQVKNISARLWVVREIMLIPLETVEIPDEYAADIAGNEDLQIVEEVKTTKTRKKSTTEAVTESTETATSATDSNTSAEV